MKIPVTSLVKEFKLFAFKGNMIDLAVAVIIGTAFGAVVNSLVKSIFMPLIALILPGKAGYREWAPGGIEVGVFLGELVNFLLVAAAVFILIVKLLGYFMKKAPPPPMKVCARCISDIPIAATRCKYCTSDVPAKV